MKRLVICLMALAAMTTVKGQVIDTVLNKVSDKPFYFSVPVNDGNYKVTVTLGAKKRAAQTVVRAESRRLMVENCVTKKGKFSTYSFIVNKRSAEIPGGKKVSLKPREHEYLNWDSLLTLEFNGASPAVKRKVHSHRARYDGAYRVSLRQLHRCRSGIGTLGLLGTDDSALVYRPRGYLQSC